MVAGFGIILWGEDHGLIKHPEIAKRIGKINKVKMIGNEHRAKTWCLSPPSGDDIVVNNLAKFCKSKNLNPQCMQLVAKSKQNKHKG